MASDITGVRQGGADDDVTRLDPKRRADQPAAASPPSPSGWLSSSDGIDHGRFSPGTILGGRYRIVARLGRGGMGEVYRADDLKLGQSVALKFLSSDVDHDPVRLTQLHAEVRMARQVSHPNVCRVYDVDEVDGHSFISMEYVDGEDLASLLRRIGRFPEDRGLEIARQICAGLAAAHERGVVHRDFKPANVMIDGSGRARIADFGLAGAAGESLRAGTPAYMAPEQLAGAEVTPRSDIYALGLVLYEIFTGRRAIEAENVAELIRRREQGEIVPPSSVTRDLSGEIDRAIMRCLAPDPAARPTSALAVSAALPGGDPLAAALAAGETPSPDMVAAAGEEGTLSRTAGFALLTFVFGGMLAVAALSGRELLVNRVAFSKPADVLEERGREVAALAGYTDAPGDAARGVAVNREYLLWVDRTDTSPGKWRSLDDGTSPLLDFWYRTSPRTLTPLGLSWVPQWDDPPLRDSGMVTVVVDDRGRLVEFAAVPPQFDPSPPGNARVDWGALFTAAGLQITSFAEVPPQWTPRSYAEQRIAWEGPMPHRADVKLRVEAAAYRGRPVAFKVVGPWSRAARMETEQSTGAQRVAATVGTLTILTLLAGAILLVRANLRSGRADRRAANRTALFLLVVWIVAWCLGARHSFDVELEMGQFFGAVALAQLNVGFTWLFYLALEPFVRRLSPDMLIGWTRLIVGHLRDPRVGRDLLVGASAGVAFLLVVSAGSLVSSLAGAPPEQPETSDMSYLLGARYALADMLRVIPAALQNAMLGAFFYVALLAIVRRRWIAGALVILFVCGLIFAESGDAPAGVSLVSAVICGVITVIVFQRFGLLALASALFVVHVLDSVPLTIDLSRPHGGVSAIAMLAVAGLAAYAFSVSRAGEGLLRRLNPSG